LIESDQADDATIIRDNKDTVAAAGSLSFLPIQFDLRRLPRADGRWIYLSVIAIVYLVRIAGQL